MGNTVSYDESIWWMQLDNEERHEYEQWLDEYDRQTETTKMDMTQFAGSESKYLKAADLQGKAVRVTISEVNLLEFDDEEKGKVTKPALALKNKEKQVVCNKTAVQDLIGAFGADSERWIGKDIRLSVKHYPAFGRDGIVITPIIEDFDDNSEIPF